ncbi:S1C family serine protease [Corynebacterium sp.]|uniref:S1C family serine protease n=1 Tax=Corynebacterium sp. TaxID=1720 RepID=UPI00264874E8|nr:trypsin-like peptidase domain-containing protein [Corynebacterium sp.]MDN6136079.1 trypsin-like peptidase domain-containing protein [Corynebacterium sp.]MDN6737893.1 trypsin-like peptidase domain-containing protein [Corynebacterium sp.]
MTSKDEHSDSPQSYSRGWNQPRSDSTQEIPATPDNAASNPPQGPYGPYGAQPQGSQGPSQGPAQVPRQQPGAQYYGQQAGSQQFGAQPTGAQPIGVPGVDDGATKTSKSKSTVGLGTALAMMLVPGIGAGGVTGYVVGNNSSSNSGTSVSEILNSQPVNNTNSTGQEAEAGTTEAVAAKVLPAVVSIQVVSSTAASEGSGSIISPDGYVLTNHHVVAGAEEGGMMRVTMNDGTKHDAEFVASDVNTDVAVIKIKDVQDLPFLEFGNSKSLQVGQEVVAVGSPLGLNATVTSGIVSAVNRPVRASQGGGQSSLIDAIQTDAAVNPGNSGGPLVDMSGNLVGMNSMIASLSAGTSGEAGSIGLGFAIPSNFAQRMAQQLIDNGEVVHPMLGVQVDGRDITDGAHVVSVEPGSAGAEAGLEEGDIITRVNDRPIEDADSLIASIRGQEFGNKITLEVTREDDDSSREVEVTLPTE